MVIIPVISVDCKAAMANKDWGVWKTGARRLFSPKRLWLYGINGTYKGTFKSNEQNLRELFAHREAQLDPKKVTLTSNWSKIFGKPICGLLEQKFSDPSLAFRKMQAALAMRQNTICIVKLKSPRGTTFEIQLKRQLKLLLQKAISVYPNRHI